MLIMMRFGQMAADTPRYEKCLSRGGSPAATQAPHVSSAAAARAWARTTRAAETAGAWPAVEGEIVFMLQVCGSSSGGGSGSSWHDLLRHRRCTSRDCAANKSGQRGLAKRADCHGRDSAKAMVANIEDAAVLQLEVEVEVEVG